MIAIAIAWFLLGLLLLALGGDSIVKAVSGLAQRFGASPFTAGLLLLAIATSLPELAVNARALLVGQPELALGNAVGSSVVNLSLTLAVAALAAPLLLRARLQGVLWWSLLGAGVLLILFGLDGRLVRWEGGVLVAGFIAMQAVLLRRGLNEKAEVQAVIADFALSRTSLPLNVLRVLVAALALLVIVPGAMYFAAGQPLAWDVPKLVGFNFRGGWVVIPELAALLVALTLYTATFIAETVRAGILAVSHGQTEAAGALGLPTGLTLRLIVIPQAMRVIIPPLTSQYLNLAKNSTLAAAIGYPDLVATFAGTVLNQTGQAIETIAITMSVYLGLSLAISMLMNWYNKRKALVER